MVWQDLAVTAGIAGLVYESKNGSMATDINGGQLVLYGVGAAVIGGTSLFGGRGKPLHALLGGIVIAAVFNGLGLMGISAAGQDIATAIVPLAAVTLDGPSAAGRPPTERRSAGRRAGRVAPARPRQGECVRHVHARASVDPGAADHVGHLPGPGRGARPRGRHP